MSDTPLFQNTDEQEEAYAPQQAPGTSDSDEAGLVVPAAAVVGTTSAGTSAGTGTGAPSAGVAPAVGAAALADEAEDQGDAADRSE